MNTTMRYTLSKSHFYWITNYKLQIECYIYFFSLSADKIASIYQLYLLLNFNEEFLIIYKQNKDQRTTVI